MDRRSTRSVRLKKYEAVYTEYLKNKSKSPEPKKNERVKPKSEKKQPEKKITDSGRGRKKLTDYQKFVKEESHKDKYKGLKPDERMAKIARAWKKHNLKRPPQPTKNGKSNT